jgi:signal transduction histidine kinase
MTQAWRARWTVTAIAAAVAVSAAAVAVSIWITAADDRSVRGVAFNAAVGFAFAVVGAVVAAARPHNRVGWLMLGGGVVWAFGELFVDIARHGLVVHPGSVPIASAFAVAGSALRGTGWAVVTLAVPLFFPDGRLAAPKWRWLVKLLALILVASALDPILDIKGDLTDFGAWRNPIGLTHPWDAIGGLVFLAHVPTSLVATVGVVAQLVSRYRGGDAFRRQQLRLFAAAALLPVVAAPVALGLGGGGWVFGAAALPLPFVIGFAVLARGLYDLRTAANRTLVWVTLSLVVAGCYALVIAGVGSLVHVDLGAAWLPWVAAAVVAISFAPLRDALQRGVNRLTFGRWDEPYDVLAALGQRLEATADVDRLLADVTTELESLGLRDVSIIDSTGRVVAGDGSVFDDDVTVALSAYGSVVGSLRYRPPVTPLRSRDRQLLDDLAGHLGGVLNAARLTAELQGARERLVLAREEERRRLRRDLHDGLGPAMAGHLLRLDVIAGKVGASSPAAADVEALRADVRATVLEVRRVVEGLRPPALDELGLAASIAQATERLTAGGGIRLDLRVDELPSLPAAVEVAAYRIVTEAVTNVVRHASASSCLVGVVADGSVLRLTVADDGLGVPGAVGLGGNGLQTMRERAEELRGRLSVVSAGGTTVVAELPLPRSSPVRGRAVAVESS